MKIVSDLGPAAPIPAARGTPTSTVLERIAKVVKDILDIREPVRPTEAPRPLWVQDLLDQDVRAKEPWPSGKRQLRLREE
jgi:hypothetical protein